MKWLPLTALALIPGPPAATESLRRPVGNWIVDYADTKCSAARNYGSPEQPITLAFRPSPSGKMVQVVIVRPGSSPAPRHFRLRTNVDAGGKVTGLRFSSTKSKAEIIWINLPYSALAGLAAAGTFEISSDPISERFALFGMGAVVKALEACNADLRAHWRYPSDEGAPRPDVGAKSVRSLAAYLSDRDYPSQAIDEGASGSTAFVLMIDETGTVKDCMVEETSGIATLDAQSCGVILSRARFKPARDASGKPVKDVVHSRITWQMR